MAPSDAEDVRVATACGTCGSTVWAVEESNRSGRPVAWQKFVNGEEF